MSADKRIEAITARIVERSKPHRGPYLERVRAAAAKGASPFRRVFAHALPNAAIPVVTIVGLNLGELIAGAIVVSLSTRKPD